MKMKAPIWKIGSALLRPTILGTSSRSFAAKAKKGGGKGGGAAAPAAPRISKEVKATTVYGANILKDGVDPPIKPDSEYPDWLWHLLDKHPPLSELQRKDPSTMTLVELQRFVKLDDRRRIKENNALSLSIDDPFLSGWVYVWLQKLLRKRVAHQKDQLLAHRCKKALEEWDCGAAIKWS